MSWKLNDANVVLNSCAREGVVLLMTRFTSRYGAVSNINEYVGERAQRTGTTNKHRQWTSDREKCVKVSV